ncbi:unnamed protein product, partial [Mesorhabditis belari]|uniref:Uncharacterized protein n=1 Tax=Mesorhabditis belari TaxID=2138241 RepID=A0AAF3F9V5_9BILA
MVRASTWKKDQSMHHLPPHCVHLKLETLRMKIETSRMNISMRKDPLLHNGQSTEVVDRQFDPASPEIPFNLMISVALIDV